MFHFTLSVLPSLSCTLAVYSVSVVEKLISFSSSQALLTKIPMKLFVSTFLAGAFLATPLNWTALSSLSFNAWFANGAFWSCCCAEAPMQAAKAQVTSKNFFIVLKTFKLIKKIMINKYISPLPEERQGERKEFIVAVNRRMDTSPE